MIHTDNRSIVEVRQGDLILDALSNGIRKLLSYYAQSYNNKYKRTGSLFRQKTKIKCLTKPDRPLSEFESVDDSIKNCFNYIHSNPVIAGHVENAEDWEFSSFREYAGIRKNSFCNLELAKLYCGIDAENFKTTTSKNKMEE
jgi:hypothetical protein